MKISEKFKQALNHRYDSNEIQAMCKIVLAYVVQKPDLHFLNYSEAHLTSAQQIQISHIIHRLRDGEPLQYVIQQAYFMGLDFYVNPHVLIPRPETEELVHLIINGHHQGKFTLIDMGTGSGCIALSLKKAFPESNVTGIDVSIDALQVAIKNAEDLAIDVQFKINDILNLTLAETYDVIVSNPPYIHVEEAKEMEAHVIQHEPHLALFVEHSNTIIFYEKIIAFAKNNLNVGGRVYFEINPLFKKQLEQCCYDYGFSKVEIISDMQGKSRFLIAQK